MVRCSHIRLLGNFDKKMLFRRMPRRVLAQWLVCMALLISANALWAAPRQTLSPHHVPAAAAKSQPNGRVAGETQMEIGIGLPLRNADAFAQLLEEIYDPA